MGVMEVAISPGRHAVKGEFLETPMRLLGDIISLMGLLLLIFIGFVKKVKIQK